MNDAMNSNKKKKNTIFFSRFLVLLCVVLYIL